MNCIEFELAAEHAIETRDPLSPAASEHLSACAVCRQSWELQQQLDVVIDAWRLVQPSASMTDAVLMELASPAGRVDNPTAGEWEEDLGPLPLGTLPGEPEIPGTWDERLSAPSFGMRPAIGQVTGPISSRFTTPGQSTTANSQKVRSGTVAMIAVAACMVIAGMLMTRLGRVDVNELSRTRGIGSIEVAKSDPPLDLSGTLTEVFSDLKSEYREMADDTRSMARDMVSAIPYRVEVSAFPESDKIELLPDSSEMVRILQPIGSRVETAFGFLWNAIPKEIPPG